MSPRPSSRREEAVREPNRPRRRKNQNMQLIIRAVIVLVVVGIAAGALFGIKNETPPEAPPIKEEPVSDDIEVDEPFVVVGGLDENPELEKAAFEQAIVQAAQARQAETLDGYLEADRILREHIINDPLFEGEEWASYKEQAQELIDTHAEELRELITGEADQLEQQIITLMEALEHQKASDLIGMKQKAYDYIPVMGKRLKQIQADMEAINQRQVDEWTKQALQKHEAGDTEGALAHLRELHSLEGMLSHSTRDKVLEVIRRIEAGVDPLDSAIDELTAADMFQQAETYYDLGNFPAAQKAYQTLQKLYPDDPLLQEEATWIAKRLGYIAELEAKAAGKQPIVLFFDDCDRMISYGRGRLSWKEGALQSNRTFNKSKGAVTSIPLTFEEAKFGNAIYGRVGKKDTLFLYEGRPVVTFWFYIDDPEGNDPNARLRVRARDHTQAFMSCFDIHHPPRNEWEFAAIPLQRWKLEEGQFGGSPKQDDRFTSLGFKYGSPGSQAKLYVDDITVVTEANLFSIRDTMLQTAREIASITSDYRKTFYTMDIYIINHLRRTIPALNKNDSVLAAGGVHINSAFTGPARKLTGKRFITGRGAGSSKLKLSELEDQLNKAIPQLQPRFVLICAGFNDINAGADPASLETPMQNIIDLALRHNTIPIVCTIPASLDENLKKPLAAWNEKLFDLADASRVPVVDAYRAFSFEVDSKSFYTNTTILNRKGYEIIAKKISAIIKVLDKHLANSGSNN